jgi:hypothetical protein
MRDIFLTKFLGAFVGRIRDGNNFDFGMFLEGRQMPGANDAARSDNSDPQFVIIFVRHASNPMGVDLANGCLFREIRLTIPRVARSTQWRIGIKHENNDEALAFTRLRRGRRIANSVICYTVTPDL